MSAPILTRRRAAAGLLGSALGYLAVEESIFGSGWYRRFLEPESAAGLMESTLRDEAAAPTDIPRIAIIGNSMLAEGFSAKIADHEAGSRLRFANLAVPGT